MYSKPPDSITSTHEVLREILDTCWTARLEKSGVWPRSWFTSLPYLVMRARGGQLNIISFKLALREVFFVIECILGFKYCFNVFLLARLLL